MVRPFADSESTMLVHPGQAPLPLRDDLRLEACRPGRGAPSISTGPTSVSTVLARCPLRELPPFLPGRVVLVVAEVVGDLALQRGLQHPLGQLLQQPALAGQLQPALAGLLGQPGDQLLVHRVQPAARRAHRPRARPGPRPLLGHHVSHRVLLLDRSYTVVFTVP